MHHFSPREKVVLMEVMGKTLLVGVTTQNIQTLATIEPLQADIQTVDVESKSEV